MTTTKTANATTTDETNLEALRKQAEVGLFSTGTIKHDQVQKDWTYLAEKEPSSNHVLQARMITELSGVEISPKQCMALLAMHRWIQKSEANQQREGFHGRTVDSVLRGSATLAERVADRVGEDLVTHRIPVTFVENVEQAEEEAHAEAAKPSRKPRAPRKTAAQKKAEAAAKAAEAPATGEF